MLVIYIPGDEYFDEETNEFIQLEGYKLRLEHSLVSISKWESKWCKPFISKKKDDKTDEEAQDYIKCMALDEDVPPEIFARLTKKDVDKINEYINAPMTATSFREDKGRKKPNNDIITSELIYYWMGAQQIPYSCENWHLNRLLTLIRVFSEKNKPAKKMSTKEINSQNAALNAARRQKLNSKG